MKKIIHIIEFLIVKIAMLIFGAMSFSVASNVGGKIGRFIGPKLKVNKTACHNIKLAMPELSDSKVEEILIGMWDNLGRVITEFPHMDKLSAQQINQLVTLDGQENLDFLKSSGGFLMTGHLGNWEILPNAIARQGAPLHIVYRKANNPYVDKIIYKMREKYQLSASHKSSIGARQIIKSLQNNGKILMLVDQKQNDGISVPFFGIEAMTAPGIATMALKYDTNIIPARIVRTQTNNFRLIVYPAIKIKKTDDEREDARVLMTQINSIIESWIREYPEQWFWVHNRWPKTKT